MAQNPIVTFEMENGGKMVAELYPEVAPNTVNNFINLVQSGFYNGLIFHRVIPGFMIQGGCPNGNGMGGPGYSIRGEFSHNGVQNSLKHDRGVLSMARAMNPNSAGSQFFIMVEKAPHLDGEYAAFGKVIEGMDVADTIVNADRDRMDKPKQEQRMKSVTVETFGVDYPAPAKCCNLISPGEAQRQRVHREGEEQGSGLTDVRLWRVSGRKRTLRRAGGVLVSTGT